MGLQFPTLALALEPLKPKKQTAVPWAEQLPGKRYPNVFIGIKR